MDFYRAIGSNGDTVEFWFSERRNLMAAKRFLPMHSSGMDGLERTSIDGNRTSREANISLKRQASWRAEHAGS